MKFGVSLSDALYSEWRYYYLDYDAVKKQLKKGTGKGGIFIEDDEATFVLKLEAELDKVAAFRNIKGDELNRRIQHAELFVRKLNLSSNEISSEEKENRIKAIDEELSKITVEVNELSKFTRLNYSGFMKIIKKHDKHTGFVLKPLFNVRLASRPFYKENFDNLILRLSRLYDTIRNDGRVLESGIKQEGGSQSFVRRTTKYWVHPDNVTEVKCIILKYLPVLVFGSKNDQDPNPAITSIYFDNDEFSLYKGRLEKTEGAEAIRIRWYGGMDQNEIFMERKTHREDWTGESSVKSRFSIKEKYVNAYLSGDYTMDKAVQKMRERGQKSEKELEETVILADEIQQTIASKALKPMVRTFYNRTAFQLPGEARVRISLDTELSMIREDNYDGVCRSGENWRRMDIGVDFPFSYLSPDDITRFPYAILEVKLQTQYGTEAPKWVDELVRSHLVEEVPKFSKFIHGISTLLEKRVSLLPFWLPQMDKDIRKPAPEGFVSPLGGKATSHGGLEIIHEKKSSKGKQPVDGKKNKDHVQVPIDEADDEGHAYVSDDETDEKTPLITNDHQSSSSRPKSVKWSENLTHLLSLGKPTSSTATSLLKSTPAKRIVLPVRVEPKVFFANERTFLSWLHFCIVLGGLALGLLNFGDRIGQICGLIFTLVAMLFMLYALFLYLWRAHKIRTRDAGPYDDRVGPTVLVFTLFFAVLMNFWLKFNDSRD